MAATGKILGTVTSVVGEVKATAADGTVRILQIGDKIHVGETINTGVGSLVIGMEKGAPLTLGANTELAMQDDIGAAGAAAPAAAPSADIAAVQAAIAAGQDPSQAAPATAAGGAPGAGGGGEGSGGTPVVIDQANSGGGVTAGFNTQGAGITFPSPEFQLAPVEEQPVEETPAINVAPALRQGFATVSEEGLSQENGNLVTGNPDSSSPADNDSTPDATVTTGTISIVDPDNSTFTVTLTAPAPGLTSGGELIDWVLSPDGHTLVGTVSDGEEGSVAIVTITIDNEGHYTVTLNGPIDHEAPPPGTSEENLLSFDVGVNVSDGTATSTTSLTITVEDDIPTVVENTGENASPVHALVHEDGLSVSQGDNVTGNPESDADEDSTSDEAAGLAGSLNALVTVNAGADAPASISFGLVEDVTGLLPTLYSNHVALVYSVEGNVLTATAGSGEDAPVVFTLTVGTDGSWSFDLTGQLDHVNDGNADNGAGDSETALYTGAESDPVSAIDFSSIITVSATDADGDTVSLDGLAAGAFTIAVENDVPVANLTRAPAYAVQEDALPDGNLDDAGQTTVQTIAASDIAGLVDSGADAPLTISLNLATEGEDSLEGSATGLTQGGQDILWHVNGAMLEGVVNGGENDGAVVFTISASGEDFEFELLDNIDNGTGEATTDSLSLDGVFVATDADGDPVIVNAGASVAIENDAPISADDYNGLDAEKSASGNVYTANDSIGADEVPAGSRVVSVSNGTDTVSAGESIAGTYGTLTINGDGSYNYQYDATPQPLSITTTSLAGATLFGEFTSDVLVDGKLVTDPGVLDGTDQAAVTGSVNARKDGWGVTLSRAGTIDDGEALVVALASKPIPDQDGQVEISFVAAQMNANQGEDAHWFAFDADGNQLATGDWDSAISNGTNFLLDVSFNVAPDEEVAYLVFTNAGHPQGYVIQEITYTALPTGIDDFTYTIQDADGDTSSSHLYITSDQFLTGDTNLTGGAGADILQGGDGGNTLDGGLGNDIVVGGAGQDVLIGGFGNDMLTGGAGGDTFVITSGGGLDTIKDFNMAPVDSGGDKLDLSDVLPVEANDPNLGAYLTVETTVDGNTIVSVDPDGAGAAPAHAIVTLEGVTGVTLQDLLNNHQIVT